VGLPDGEEIMTLTRLTKLLYCDISLSTGGRERANVITVA